MSTQIKEFEESFRASNTELAQEVLPESASDPYVFKRKGNKFQSDFHKKVFNKQEQALTVLKSKQYEKAQQELGVLLKKLRDVQFYETERSLKCQLIILISRKLILTTSSRIPASLLRAQTCPIQEPILSMTSARSMANMDTGQSTAKSSNSELHEDQFNPITYGGEGLFGQDHWKNNLKPYHENILVFKNHNFCETISWLFLKKNHIMIIFPKKNHIMIILLKEKHHMFFLIALTKTISCFFFPNVKTMIWF